jgi:hypothetical protein
MTTQLLSSFRLHVGERGCHFYDDDTCNFLTWKDIFKFLKEIPPSYHMNAFSEKLTDSLANYDPNKEYLAVHQAGTQLSIELYCEATGGKTLKR